jgi:hypothetical protein
MPLPTTFALFTTPPATVFATPFIPPIAVSPTFLILSTVFLITSIAD